MKYLSVMMPPGSGKRFTPSVENPHAVQHHSFLYNYKEDRDERQLLDFQHISEEIPLKFEKKISLRSAAAQDKL